MFGDLRRSRRVAYTAAFIGLITLGGWISVPFVPVPFTLQTFFVLLAAAAMKRDAVIPVALYVALGALGLPVFHNGIAGFGVLLGPTGGYLLGFIPAVLLAGILYESDVAALRIAGLAGAAVLILLCGATWLIVSTGMAPAAALIIGMAVFLPGEAVKVGAVYLVGRQLP
ncbi:MAG: biotin transporter BioY [Methanoregula sp.]|uniref:biotin transporter BioY n=1 Tax=Methanoregula sp. TaxID=2052170 RepID=UPI003FD8F936